MDQTLIQMKALTTGFGDPMVKFKVMVDLCGPYGTNNLGHDLGRFATCGRRVLVYPEVVSKQYLQVYRCIQKVLFKPHLQLPECARQTVNHGFRAKAVDTVDRHGI